MRYVPMASAWFLAALFLFTGSDKVFHYDGFVNALASYAVVPADLAPTLAPAVILIEILIGLGLVFRPWRPTSALVAAVTLGIFTLVLGANQIYAPGTVCGCWFTLTLAKSTGGHVALNLVLLGLALTVWLEGRGSEHQTAAEAPAALS